MFHRVRPENEQEARASSKENPKSKSEETKSQAAEMQRILTEKKSTQESADATKAQPSEQAESSEPTQVRTEDKTKDITHDKTKTQKDIQNMNQNAQDRTVDATQEERAQTGSFDKAYQRPGQAPVQQPSYAASYASTSSYVAPTAPDTSYSGDRTLTIGRGITMSGEIEACDYLLVEGTVEAALKGASMLEISESGTFYGTVEIEEANVAGRFEGDITVRGRLTIKSGGVITGSIAYGELEVESGAVIDGRLTPVSAKAPAQAQTSQREKPAAEALKKAKEQDPAPANNDGELFANKAAS